MEYGDRLDGLREWIGAQLRTRGDTIAEIVEKAGRKVPRRARSAIAELTDIEALASNPKVARRIDPRTFKRAEARVRKHLGKLDPKAARRGEILDRVAMVAFVLVSVGLGLFFYAISQGAFDR